MVRPVFRILVFLVLPLVSFADEEMDYMQKYVGRWLGYFTIHSAATGYSETFPVEQRYWMEDGKLHGLSVSDTDRGIQTASSITFLKDEKIRSEVTRGNVTKSYWGLPHDTGIVWLSTDLDRASDYQLKEAFVVVEGELQLHTDGFDTFVFKDGLGHLIFRGRLKKIVEEEVSEEKADEEVEKVKVAE